MMADQSGHCGGDHDSAPSTQRSDARHMARGQHMMAQIPLHRMKRMRSARVHVSQQDPAAPPGRGWIILMDAPERETDEQGRQQSH